MKTEPTAVIPAQAGIQTSAFQKYLKITVNPNLKIPTCAGMTAVGSVFIRKRTYKGRLKTNIAESAKSFSDDLFFKDESNQPAG